MSLAGKIAKLAGALRAGRASYPHFRAGVYR